MGANQSIRAGHIRAASSSSLHPPVSGARGRAARARSGSYANMRCQLIRFSPSISLPPRLGLPISLALTHTSCVACLFLSLSLSLCLRTYKVPRVNQLELFSFPISYADCGRAASATRESQPPHVPMSAFSDKEQPERARKRPRDRASGAAALG